MFVRLTYLVLTVALAACSQLPKVEPGIAHNLAKWRAERYSDVRYKIDLTLEEMAPAVRGSIEIRVHVAEPSTPVTSANGATGATSIILDWRKIRGSESLSTLSNGSINNKPISLPGTQAPVDSVGSVAESNEHLIFRDGVVNGENVIKLDFTSPILTSGSALTRYVDKEDGSEYVYSLFVPSDASTAFPLFDQPDLKAKFSLSVRSPEGWQVVSNGPIGTGEGGRHVFDETKPISTYVFAFAAGPFDRMSAASRNHVEATRAKLRALPRSESPTAEVPFSIYVRRSQSAKLQPHFPEVLRLNREAIKYLQRYFDYDFPFPKYDVVLIPEFPFGGMEHAGATFLREDRIIFPQEPTKNDHVTRANLIFHESAHQWFGDTVTMRWFDDLWLKEGFAEFMAYKTLENVVPEHNAWKIFYERNKQAAYLTDSTKGTTPIYQEIPNLAAAKSAYGNIVYRKAPSFLKQAEFYVGEERFQAAVRSLLKNHAFANASWEDLVKELELSSGRDLQQWGKIWITQKGLPTFRVARVDNAMVLRQASEAATNLIWKQKLSVLIRDEQGQDSTVESTMTEAENGSPHMSQQRLPIDGPLSYQLIFPNYGDHGYGIFLLDSNSLEYTLKNIAGEKDDFLRAMLWGSLWDSVREGELDPRQYVELVVNSLNSKDAETDESTIQTLLGRVSLALRYYVPENPEAEDSSDLTRKVEDMLIDKMQHASTPGQRITYYRAFLSIGSSANARRIMKIILRGGNTGGEAADVSTKDKFDIVTRLIILGDPESERLLAGLEHTETSDAARRYAYAARAGFATPENKAKYWNDFVNNRDVSESWIEAAFTTFNNVKHAELTLPYLDKALGELPKLKAERKIFFVNGWLAAFIGGQRSKEALTTINKFLASNPKLDDDLRLKILENADTLERAVQIRRNFGGELD